MLSESGMTSDCDRDFSKNKAGRWKGSSKNQLLLSLGRRLLVAV